MQARLEHAVCSLVPLSHDHTAGLVAVVSAGTATADATTSTADNAPWRNTHLHIPAPSAVTAYIDRSLTMKATGREIPYAIISPQGTVLGTTRFQSVNLVNRRADIGSTWLAPAAQGSGVNTASKWLMLRHAFEVMGLHRVGFTVHPDNARSRAALVAIGAVFEGILRDWQTLHGVQTDMCSYAVTRSAWAEVAARLESRIAKQRHVLSAPSPQPLSRLRARGLSDETVRVAETKRYGRRYETD